MSEVIVTMGNFEEEVMKSDKPVLIDFFATWCGPCKMLSPIISEIADEHPEIKVCKVDIDEQEGLAVRFNVASIPTLVVVKDGQVKATAVGARPKKQIIDMVIEGM